MEQTYCLLWYLESPDTGVSAWRPADGLFTCLLRGLSLGNEEKFWKYSALAVDCTPSYMEISVWHLRAKEYGKNY